MVRSILTHLRTVNGGLKAQNRSDPTPDDDERKKELYRLTKNFKVGEVSYKCKHGDHSSCTMQFCACKVCNHPMPDLKKI